MLEIAEGYESLARRGDAGREKPLDFLPDRPRAAG
jgi:hypothetical protein